MKDALIGYSGFVGSTLLRQRPFEALFRSTNIADIVGQRFGTVVCAGAPAQKWIANREPGADRQNIERLMTQLDSVQCDRLILISTVDVFGEPLGVTEETPVDETNLHPYGLHRRLLEKFVERRFPDHLIVRLPGLVGPGLRKNVIYDFLNDNNLQAIDSRSEFQFYPMVNLWADLQTASRAGLRLVHLTAEPVSVGHVAQAGFGRPFEQVLGETFARYDMRTVHAELFGGHGGYQYAQRESLLAIRAFAQSEPVAKGVAAG